MAILGVGLSSNLIPNMARVVALFGLGQARRISTPMNGVEKIPSHQLWPFKLILHPLELLSSSIRIGHKIAKEAYPKNMMEMPSLPTMVLGTETFLQGTKLSESP